MSPTISITDEDCRQILRNTRWEEDTYCSNELTPFTQGRSGHLGEHYKLKIKLEGTLEEPKFFIKCIPRRYCLNRKEEGFYSKIVPEFLKYKIEELKHILPECYYIKSFDYIVLEDLMVKRFETLSPQMPLDKTYALRVLKSLARYHAASVIYETKKQKELGKEFIMTQCFTEELQEIYYRGYPDGKNVLQAIRNTIAPQVVLFEEDVCKTITKDELVSRLISLWDIIGDYVIPSKEYNNVICHGDLWQANLMFSFNDATPEECIVIDEQMIRYCPPAQDVMSFLHLSTNRELRENHLNTLLDSYYEFLREMLWKYEIDCDAFVSKEDFLRSCDTYKPFALMQAFSYAHITYMPTELFEKFMGQEGEKTKFLFETRASALKKFCEEDNVYRERQLECLLELVEYVTGDQETKL